MKNYKNLLLINYGGIGDEILFLPTISSIKKQYPRSKITLALEPRSKSIINLAKEINEIITIDIKAKGIKKYINILKFIVSCWFKNYDCAISSGKSPFVAIILFLTFIKERIGYNSKTDFLLTKKIMLNENQYAGKMYHDLAKPIIENNYENPQIIIEENFTINSTFKKNQYICIHPGVSKMSISKNIYKCPDEDFWINLINGLLKKNKQIVLLGTNDDKDLINKILAKIPPNQNFINYFNKTKNILEMAFVMKNSANVICVDSAPLHVAVGVGANIIAIFGPTNEKKLIPEAKNITVITNDCDCRPCLWHKRIQNCISSHCLNIDYNLILDKIN